MVQALDAVAELVERAGGRGVFREERLELRIDAQASDEGERAGGEGQRGEEDKRVRFDARARVSLDRDAGPRRRNRAIRDNAPR